MVSYRTIVEQRGLSFKKIVKILDLGEYYCS